MIVALRGGPLAGTEMALPATPVELILPDRPDVTWVDLVSWRMPVPDGPVGRYRRDPDLPFQYHWQGWDSDRAAGGPDR